MRYRTVQNRLRLSCLSGEIKWDVYIEMKGVSDESTKSGKGQRAWVRAVKNAFEKDKPNASATK